MCICICICVYAVAMCCACGFPMCLYTTNKCFCYFFSSCLACVFVCVLEFYIHKTGFRSLVLLLVQRKTFFRLTMVKVFNILKLCFVVISNFFSVDSVSLSSLTSSASVWTKIYTQTHKQTIMHKYTDVTLTNKGREKHTRTHTNTHRMVVLCLHFIIPYNCNHKHTSSSLRVSARSRVHHMHL